MLNKNSRSRLLIFLALTAGFGRAGTIQYEVSPIRGSAGPGQSAFRFTYQLTDFQLLAYQELDIRFDATNFVKLFNPIATPGLDVLVLQPNNPPGAAGDLSILALVERLNLLSFSLDAIVTGAIPGSLRFAINEYDPETLEFIRTVSEGRAVLAGIPEPSILWLMATGLLSLGALMARRRS